MERNVLEQYFCSKISHKLKAFQEQMLELPKQELYDLAYQIDYTIRIYEILIEQSQRLEDRQLQSCLRIPGLLAFLYGEWLKIPDVQREEEEQIILHLLQMENRNDFREETIHI